MKGRKSSDMDQILLAALARAGRDSSELPESAIFAGPRRSKYNVGDKSKRTFEGIVFDSAQEMERWAELRMLEKAHIITDLERQVEYILVEKFKHPTWGNIRAIKYVADIRYREIKTWKLVVEEVKGVRTRDYIIKRTLFLLRYPDIDFRELHK